MHADLQMRTKTHGCGPRHHGAIKQNMSSTGHIIDLTSTACAACATRGVVRKKIRNRTQRKIIELGVGYEEFDSVPQVPTLSASSHRKNTMSNLKHDAKSERLAVVAARLTSAPKYIGFLKKLLHYLIETREDTVTPGELSPETIAYVQARIDVMADLTSLRQLLDTLMGRRVMG